MHVLVVGGGLAGAGAAWELLKGGAHVTLVESEAELGGRARTFLWHGEWAIRGAGAFISSETNLKTLAQELGVFGKGDYRESPSAPFPVLYKNDRIVTLRDLTVAEILRCPMLPVAEKVALGRVLPALLKQMSRNDPCDPTSAVEFDTLSACDFFRRHSPHFADYILQPAMGGFCGFRAEDFSLAWLLWLMAGRNWAERWWSFTDRGVGRLAHELEAALAFHDRCHLLRSTSAQRLDVTDDRVEASLLSGSTTITVTADAAVVAVPGCLVNHLMPGLDEPRRRFFDAVRYVGHHVTHVLAERPKSELRPQMLLPAVDGHGCLPFIFLRPLPNGLVWFQSELDGRYCAETLGAPAEDILDDAWDVVLKHTPALRGQKVIDRCLVRNDLGIPSRYVGYTRALAEFKALGPLHRVAFAGDYLINSTVGQAHMSGLLAARQIMTVNTPANQ